MALEPFRGIEHKLVQSVSEVCIGVSLVFDVANNQGILRYNLEQICQRVLFNSSSKTLNQDFTLTNKQTLRSAFWLH